MKIVGPREQAREAFAEWAEARVRAGDDYALKAAAHGVASFFSLVDSIGMDPRVAANEVERAGLYAAPDEESWARARQGIEIGTGEAFAYAWETASESAVPFADRDTDPAPPSSES